MDITENRKKYRESIGEFITVFAEVELYLTMYDAIIKTKTITSVPLVVSFSVPFTKKLKNINKFIVENFDNDLNKRWADIQAEINNLNLYRNHIIHGTGFSSFWGESTKTMIDEERKLQSLSFKNLSIKDIKALSERTYHVLTGNDGIQGFFLQDFFKESTKYFTANH